jgi:hypothetical protein
MTLLVRDEIDIVADMLDFHYALGVDHVIAMDHLSRDGTTEVLERYRDEGRLTLVHQAEDVYDQARWVTGMARRAATELGADWVINADADEFWYPTRGDLRDAFATVPEDVGVVVVHRWNFLPRDDGEDAFHRRMRWRYAAERNHEGIDLPTKVAHRAHPEAVVFMGNHWVEHEAGRSLDDGRIELLHFPMRSYAQFAAKITVGGAALERTGLDPGLVASWRRMLVEHREGRFEARWREWCPTDDELARLVADGEVVEDTRVTDVLDRARAGSPPAATGSRSEVAPTRGRRVLGRWPGRRR